MATTHQKLIINAQKIEIVDEKLSNQPESYCLNSWMNRLLMQREKLMLFNQKYWGNLRRKEWLINSDQNSRYFQQKANSQRKRKLLCKLKGDCGLWIDNQRDIAETFVSDYTSGLNLIK